MSFEDDQRRVLLNALERLNAQLLAKGAEPAVLAVDVEDRPLREIESAIWHARRRLVIIGEQ